ncbi:sulfotransferase family 5A, member 1 [Denticeps clupeoides]|uniref:Sulfotransferase n=1 Tax=Denticeps clupeoides TaxID=299321 RepID=A0AAY4BSF9_9TELE|nr:sulfotransferase family cytosolic 2B member 1-like [Denticeps clupeoides]
MARLEDVETFHNISFPGHMHTQKSLSYATSFQFQDSDIVIITYPKSGTTWMQEMVSLVLNRGDPTLSTTTPNWARAPWLEHYYCPQVLCTARCPRVITSHLPHQLLLPALKASKAKVIYVFRNPKDVAVSYYYFHKMAKFLPEPGLFDDFLDKFLEGTVHYGSWFDHVNGWTNSVEDIENFFHITYEEMWQDPRSSLQRLCAFLQRPLQEEEVASTLKHCSFGFMKENAMVNYTLVPQDIVDHSQGKFMRKGKIGDWKNTFSDVQSHRLDTVFKAQMQNSGLTFIWESLEAQKRTLRADTQTAAA